ncbi:MAG: hypothetical protein C0609_03940 [Deltaproteobacteria bacterium]|nr:MAG: hypothetical protein C0609_03940 [Deltaproteobacteria bacterium]
MEDRYLESRAVLFGTFVALAGALLAGGQAAYIAINGAELCISDGCALVGQLTRIPPLWFNLLGSALFLSVALGSYVLYRTGLTGVKVLLHLVLTAAFAAEGVLFTYQYFVASAWCPYCLVLLTLILSLNLILLGRGALFGFAAFAASATIFSLLTFAPFNKDLTDGTYAVKKSDGGMELFLLFDQDCPHCKEVEEALEPLDGCTVYYNPVSVVTKDLFPGLEKEPLYDYRVNFSAASLMGLDRIPILIAKKDTGREIVTGTSNIIDFVEAMCGGEEPLLDFGGGAGGFSGGDSSTGGLFTPPDDEGCGLVADPDCVE